MAQVPTFAQTSHHNSHITEEGGTDAEYEIIQDQRPPTPTCLFGQEVGDVRDISSLR